MFFVFRFLARGERPIRSGDRRIVRDSKEIILRTLETSRDGKYQRIVRIVQVTEAPKHKSIIYHPSILPKHR